VRDRLNPPISNLDAFKKNAGSAEPSRSAPQQPLVHRQTGFSIRTRVLRLEVSCLCGDHLNLGLDPGDARSRRLVVIWIGSPTLRSIHWKLAERCIGSVFHGHSWHYGTGSRSVRVVRRGVAKTSSTLFLLMDIHLTVTVRRHTERRRRARDRSETREVVSALQRYSR
jgi:hypothetical protein